MPNNQRLVTSLPPSVVQALQTTGEHIRIARKRRRETLESFSKRIGVSVTTLRNLEAGDPGVSSGCFYAALWALGLLGQAEKLATPETDEVGTTMEMARLPRRIREAKDEF